MAATLGQSPIDFSEPTRSVILWPKFEAQDDVVTQALMSSSSVPLIWVATSGSLGRKWLGLSRAALLASAKAVNAHLKVQPGDRWLNVLPKYHVGGLGIYARAWLAKNDVYDTSETRWSAQDFVKALKVARITLSSLVPAQVYDLVAANLRPPETVRALVVGGGALAPELYRQARQLGWPLLPSYGLSELASQVATASLATLESRADQEHLAADLQLLSHVSARVDEQGRLELKGSSAASVIAREVEPGHWRTSEVGSGTWLATEDLAEIHGGFLRPLGRRDSTVKVVGELVSLEQLNGVFSEIGHELVPGFKSLTPAVLIAIPELRRQNDVVVVAEKSLSWAVLQRLVERLCEKVKPFERPQAIYRFDKLPRSPLGKLRRPEILKALGLAAGETLDS